MYGDMKENVSGFFLNTAYKQDLQ